MDNNSLFIKSVKQKLIYLIILITFIMVNYRTTANYLHSFWILIDIITLLIAIWSLLADVIPYILEIKDAEIKEELDMINEEYEEDAEEDRKWINTQDIFNKVLTVLIIIQVVIYILRTILGRL
jgi:hypothetical protein